MIDNNTFKNNLSPHQLNKSVKLYRFFDCDPYLYEASVQSDCT